jgi:hypothetical protein
VEKGIKSLRREVKLRAILKNKFIKLLVLPLLISLTGCIYLVVGGIGAVGGYIVSPDTVEGITENDTTSVWDSAMEVVSFMGTITEEHEDGGMILAKINKASVTINILALNQATVKITVKARKFYLPKISVAQDVFLKIMNQLEK